MTVRIDVGGSRKLWRAAGSLRELCDLSERFVRGEISFFPGWNAPDLDVESDEIAAFLAGFARAGFLTCASQPARADQRAFVAGFVDTRSARKLALVSNELDVRLFQQGGRIALPLDSADIRDLGQSIADGSQAEPVSRAHGRFHAFAGHDARYDELACFEGEIGASAFVELQHAIYVSAFDPEWSRRHLLWSELSRALETR